MFMGAHVAKTLQHLVALDHQAVRAAMHISQKCGPYGMSVQNAAGRDLAEDGEMNKRLSGGLAGAADHFSLGTNRQQVLRGEHSLGHAALGNEKLQRVAMEKHAEIAAGSEHPVALVEGLANRDQGTNRRPNGFAFPTLDGTNPQVSYLEAWIRLRAEQLG